MLTRKSRRKDPVEYEVTKTEDEWKQELPADRYRVLRKAGTEPAWSGELLHVDGDGIFHCAACNAELFDTDAKFESGTGWPSFWQPISRFNVGKSSDSSFGMQRDAVSCRRCDAPLRHTRHDPIGVPLALYCAALVLMIISCSMTMLSVSRVGLNHKADLLSGPGGLASFLRTRQLGARLAGPSLPLDIGYASTIPPGIRNAVILRDKRCRWAGGCHQPAAACEVHHVKHKADGGHTSTRDCVLLCWFHHQIVIHRWGWTLVLNPDGTTTAWNPGRTKVLHSHSPPARTG